MTSGVASGVQQKCRTKRLTNEKHGTIEVYNVICVTVTTQYHTVHVRGHSSLDVSMQQ